MQLYIQLLIKNMLFNTLLEQYLAKQTLIRESIMVFLGMYYTNKFNNWYVWHT